MLNTTDVPFWLVAEVLQRLSSMSDEHLAQLFSEMNIDNFEVYKRILQLNEKKSIRPEELKFQMPNGTELYGKTLILSYSSQIKSVLDNCEFEKLEINQLKPRHFDELMNHPKVKSVNSLKFIGNDRPMPRRGNGWILSQLHMLTDIKEVVVEYCCADPNDAIYFIDDLKQLDTNINKMRKMRIYFTQRANYSDQIINNCHLIVLFKEPLRYNHQKLFAMNGLHLDITIFVSRKRIGDKSYDVVDILIHEERKDLAEYVKNICEIKKMMNRVEFKELAEMFLNVNEVYPEKKFEEEVFKRLSSLPDDLLLEILKKMNGEALLASQMINMRIVELSEKIRDRPLLKSILLFRKSNRGLLELCLPRQYYEYAVNSMESLEKFTMLLSAFRLICFTSLHFTTNPKYKIFVEEFVFEQMIVLLLKEVKLRTRRLVLSSNLNLQSILDHVEFDEVIIRSVEPRHFREFISHPNVKKATTVTIVNWSYNTRNSDPRLSSFGFNCFKDNKSIIIHYKNPYDLIPFLKELRLVDTKSCNFRVMNLSNFNRHRQNTMPSINFSGMVDGLQRLFFINLNHGITQKRLFAMLGTSQYISIYIDQSELEDDEGWKYNLEVIVHKNKRALFDYGMNKIIKLKKLEKEDIDANDFDECSKKFIDGDWDEMRTALEEMKEDLPEPRSPQYCENCLRSF